ncbi:MAG: hypothetical protein IT219_06895 [Bacteroidales bacterium]|nr:hypothetical protein [Bacteroidales bacterium]
MKKNINIYVEGEGEICFFSILLKHHFDYNLQFQKVGDYTNMIYKSDYFTVNLRPFNLDLVGGGIDGKKIRQVANEIKINIEKKETNILIIDADTESHKPAGGFNNRYKYLEGLKLEFGIEFYFFLIPDHNNQGNLETLLENLVSEKGKPFFKCLTNYSSCLAELLKIQVPVELNRVDDFNKKKFEWYIYNMLGTKYANETSLSKRDYTRNELWNLDSDSLLPLLNFLKTCLPISSLPSNT